MGHYQPSVSILICIKPLKKMAVDCSPTCRPETTLELPEGSASLRRSIRSRFRAAEGRAFRADEAGTPDRVETLTLHLAPERVANWLLLIAAILLFVGITAFYLRFGVASHYEYSDTFMALFDLDSESNVPTWFSSVLLLANASLLALIAFAAFRVRDRWRWYWCGLALVFVYLSMDETAMLHERAVVPLREMFHLSGPLYFAWVIPAMVCLVVFACIYLRFALALPPKTFLYFGFAALFYVGGALGMEMVASNYVSQFGSGNFLYGLMVIIEESLEVFGQVVFFYALANYMVARWKSVVIGFGV